MCIQLAARNLYLLKATSCATARVTYPASKEVGYILIITPATANVGHSSLKMGIL